MQTSVLQNCPVCSAAVYFHHDTSNLITCRCGAVLERTVSGLLSRNYPIIQRPFDLIQPGATGTVGSSEFTVTGRIRAWFEDSVFNYWTIVFNNGDLAILGEGYGLYAVLRPTSPHPDLSAASLQVFSIGHSMELMKSEKFVLEKKSSCKRWELEGEAFLPEAAPGFTVYELSSVEGRHLHLFETGTKNIHFFEAKYFEFEDLRLANLRHAEIPLKQFSCTACKNTIVVATFPFAQSCACTSCGRYYSLQGQDFKSLSLSNQIDALPGMALGSTGKINDVSYQLVGFAIKRDDSQYASQWREYSLYNREHGYAFLSEYDGHWTFLKEKGDTPVLPEQDPKSFTFNKEPFQLYNGYTCEVVCAAGEFPYNIFNSRSTYIKEFISPPELWSKEMDDKNGITWFLGKHMDSLQLATEFSFPQGLPPQTGMGAVEPKFFLSIEKLAIIGGVGLLILVLVHTLFTFSKKNQVVLDRAFSFSDSVHTVSYISPAMRFDKWRSAMQFDISAPVFNSWFELDATLVNMVTGTEYSLQKGVEFYSGYEGGEHWSEGSTSEEAYLTSVPAGSYILQIQGIRDPTPFDKLSEFSVRVTYDVSAERNLFFSILLLMIWPVIMYFRTRGIEQKRWYNSPYSPYTYED